MESAVLPDGHTLCVGDVVWGRAEVNGWWPGKVVNLMMKEEGKAFAQVGHTQLAIMTVDSFL